MDDSVIAAIRRFNRFYTRVIGLLEEGMHKSPFSLAEARVLFEIGKRGRCRSSELGRELGMDRGQLSRLLWRLSDQGHVAWTPDLSDRRANNLSLTGEGDLAVAKLDAMSDAAADSLVAPLPPPLRAQLVAAMRTIEALLTRGRGTAEPALRGHRIGELGWLIHRQGLLYHQEQGWNGAFESLIARLYGEFEAAADPKKLWVAELDGAVAGSVYIVPAPGEERTAQLRMLYVEPWARGRGIGQRLVAEAVDFSRAAGCRRVILWTQDCLASARAIYQAAGFTLLREERHHSFGADLNGQYWGLDLTGPG